MKSYSVKKQLRHNGQTYKSGDGVALSEKEAERLLRLKVIEGDGQELQEAEVVADQKDAGFDADKREEELNKMTVDELKTLAKEKGIDLRGSTKKEDIVTEIILFEA